MCGARPRPCCAPCSGRLPACRSLPPRASRSASRARRSTGCAPLGLPDDRHHAAESDSVRLFLDRVRGLKPDFVVADADLDAIVRVCRRLEGMPLGIELAAARIRILSPAELADRLDTSFQVLGGAKAATGRQRTLEATLAWSNDLLTPDERAVFRRLSVFAGGFDLRATEAVCAAGPVETSTVLDHLDSLVDKSLVLAIPGLRPRFRLLEPIRQYAEARLRQSDEWASIRIAHAAHFAAVVAEAAPHIRGPEQMAWERRLDVDYSNIRVALRTLLESGDVDRYLDMGFDLFIYWMHLGMHVEGVGTLLAGLHRVPATIDPLRLVKAWSTVTGLGSEITDPASIEHARAGLAVATAMGDPNAIGHMELMLGAAIRHSTTMPDYLRHVEEGRRLLESNPEPYWWEPAWERGLSTCSTPGACRRRTRGSWTHSCRARRLRAHRGPRDAGGHARRQCGTHGAGRRRVDPGQPRPVGGDPGAASRSPTGLGTRC